MKTNKNFVATNPSRSALKAAWTKPEIVIHEDAIDDVAGVGGYNDDGPAGFTES